MRVRAQFPNLRIAELVDRFGGLTRDEAVEAATQLVEALRPQADQEIHSAVVLLETGITVAEMENGSDASIRALFPLCDRIVTVAGIYGYAALDKASRSLGDLLVGLICAGKRDIASIQVHVRTIRLLALNSVALGEEQIATMLSELAKLLDYHGISSMGEPTASEF